MAWLSGYSKRKEITITGGASGAQTDFQLKLTVAFDGDMQSDFDDLRFTQADGQTLIDAWLETKTDDTSATVWAEFPTTPANTVEQTYYMYYGNVGAASDWDGAATFLFFDDLSGDLSKWTVNNFAIVGEELKTNDVVDAYAYHNFVLTTSHIIDYKCKIASVGSGHSVGGFGSNPYFDGAAEIFLRSDATNINLYENSVALFAIGSWATISFSLGDSKIYVNDVYKTTTAKSGTHLQFGMVRGDKHIGYYDDIRVRKYAANPPTYAFGAEESSPDLVPVFCRHNPCLTGGMA